MANMNVKTIKRSTEDGQPHTQLFGVIWFADKAEADTFRRLVGPDKRVSRVKVASQGPYVHVWGKSAINTSMTVLLRLGERVLTPGKGKHGKRRDRKGMLARRQLFTPDTTDIVNTDVSFATAD